MNTRGLGIRLMWIVALLYLPIEAVIGGDLTVDGQVNANSFSGNGSLLTNIPAGPQGPAGANGDAGQNGLACWDIDRDGVQDVGEDVNGDGNYDTLDCAGPAGGIVFFVSNGGISGLEAALANLPGTYPWCCNGTDIPGAEGIAVGTGNQITIEITDACIETNYAAKQIRNVAIQGHTDWFLPSVGEMLLMPGGLTQAQLGVPATGFSAFWSSTEASPIGAQVAVCTASQGIVSCFQQATNKTAARSFRPVRAF